MSWGRVRGVVVGQAVLSNRRCKLNTIKGKAKQTSVERANQHVDALVLFLLLLGW